MSVNDSINARVAQWEEAAALEVVMYRFKSYRGHQKRRNEQGDAGGSVLARVDGVKPSRLVRLQPLLTSHNEGMKGDRTHVDEIYRSYR